MLQDFPNSAVSAVCPEQSFIAELLKKVKFDQMFSTDFRRIAGKTGPSERNSLPFAGKTPGSAPQPA
ncbi:hypothetical protein U8326_07150 [Tsuneonella sp. CC-YZS046]|uniref:hypothetical protein n=1 Tax=Tsuneonella sp. CC-YZS046 TaxID=3042152 RepID=UPI002D7703CB|nr:hypothetical protein [Tsuneonella sp. CC-YZS046]WRO67922.1 hypothetical protein U8326_07150 [Tsuneonella sp. CC-YZS046]